MIWDIPRLKGGILYNKEKLLEMLKSNKASDRYEACERLRLSKESSPEIVTALDKATNDEDKDIVERAILALSSDVHYHMAVKMGVIEPDTVSPLSRLWNILYIVVGGFLTLLSLSLIVLAFISFFNRNTSEGGWFISVINRSSVGWISLFFGIPFLIKGLQNIILVRKEGLRIKINNSKVIRHRNWGWILVIVGGLILLPGICIAIPGLLTSNYDYFIWFIIALWLFMMIGVPILIIGFWFIVNQRKNEQEEIGNKDEKLSNV